MSQTNLSKCIGGILLIVGTSIGGGMLALPESLADAGIMQSILFLSLCWIVMTMGALLVLEVNLRLPEGSNMISMAKTTLGKPGAIIAWITYLFLLYTLLSAYISGGSDVFMGILQQTRIIIPLPLTTILFTLIFSFIIYSGIRTVDYVNRTLMFGKLGVYLLLIIIITPHIDITKLQGGHVRGIMGSIMILITSFGFASIVPSLRDYFHSDVQTLRKIIIIGSLIPLLCYIAWNAVIMGVIGRDGANGLLALKQSEHATSGLTQALSNAVHSAWIAGFFSFFTSICMITAFLGVSLGLFDFLADGLRLKRTGRQGRWTLLLTFLPPLLIVLIYPGIYLQALNYAGFACVFLLLLLPTVMAWQGRKTHPNSDLLPGGRITLLCIGSVALGLLIVAWVL